MKKKSLSSLIFALMILTISCSSGSTDESSETSSEISYFVITNADKMYTMDDVEGAGLKNAKSFITDAVDRKTGELITPGATEIHLGFFKSSAGPKDIEVRFYGSHQDAIDLGKAPAESVTEKPSNLVGNSSVTTLADAGVGMKGSTKYGGYAITGNLVLLCERSLDVCNDFIEALP